MTFDFYSSKSDKLEILDYIFQQTDLHIYDLGSIYEQEINEYRSTLEISSKFDLEKDEYNTTFKLWSPSHGSKPTFRRIELNPKYCDGHTFRYATSGLGLIQLYFGGLNKVLGENQTALKHSHIGHFNEKGALKNQTSEDLMKDWNWGEIQKTSRNLKYHIAKKLSVGKINSLDVLKGADELQSQGIKFVW